MKTIWKPPANGSDSAVNCRISLCIYLCMQVCMNVSMYAYFYYKSVIDKRRNPRFTTSKPKDYT